MHQLHLNPRLMCAERRRVGQAVVAAHSRYERFLERYNLYCSLGLSGLLLVQLKSCFKVPMTTTTSSY